VSALVRDKLPGLDGLRAIAVLLVIFFHQELLPCGWIGVQIFFVLSGYLITGLLWRARDASLGRFLLEFYGRRALRIFPIYYLLLALIGAALLLGVEMDNVRPGLLPAATYTYNLWHASNRYGHSEVLSHFWSLCVEEQFYLLWPFLLFFCPKRRIRSVLLALALAGPLVRLLTVMVLRQPGLPVDEDEYAALYVLTSTHFDAFALGGLVRLFPWNCRPRVLLVVLAATLAGGIAMKLLSGAPWRSLGFVLGMSAGYGYLWAYSALNLLSALLIDGLVRRRFLPRVFDWPPLAYIGKISYGVYLFHYPIQWLLKSLLPSAPSVQLGLHVPLTIGVAALSFHLCEVRLLALRDAWFPARAWARAPRAAS
jgi:peptidoglycan/LPS O-acetylase OafA/YrhL